MRIRLVLILVLMAISLFSNAGDINFKVSAIPANLLENAHVVKRLDETRFVINSTSSTTFRRHYAFTILNENGEDQSEFEVYYDKLRKVNLIEGNLYNAEGKLIKKLKNKDVKDLSASDDNSLMDDSRKKTHDFYYQVYPYTIEYTVEVSFNNTFVFPPWVPQESESMAVEQSSYTLVYPESYQVRFKPFNYKGAPETSVEKGKRNMKWSTSLLPAFKIPAAIGSWRDLVTVVYFAPSDFELEGFKGDMKTWEDFGKFQSVLNAGRDVLPANILQKVSELTKGITDKKEKIRVLYQYLQKNTRYISVQLGIGGWQPFTADYVAKNGYGDCKALSNYMYSLLKAAGIASNYTIINAGTSSEAKTRVINDFPSNSFNHVILCVPLEKDTMWLECTSQQLPAGYMSDFTANRKAVMITNKGGAIVSTPRYGLDENEQIRTIKAKIDENGTLNMKVNTVYKCVQQDELSQRISYYSKDKMKEYLEKALALSTYRVNDFSYKENRNMLPSINQQLDITSDNYATVTGKRLFIEPNILNRSEYRFEEDITRKVNLYFDYAYRDKDEIEIEIPEGYTLEAKAKDISLKTEFGNYSIATKIEGNKIIYTRLREQFSGSFPVDLQKKAEEFYNNIFKYDRERLVLVKK